MAEEFKRPNPSQFMDCKAYLTAMAEYLGTTREGFTFRGFSREAGFGAPNYYQLVMTGRRRLTRAAIPKFARGLKLSESEWRVFEALANYNLAKDEGTRRHYLGVFQDCARENGSRLKDDALLWYVSDWRNLALRELVRREDFVEDTAWISAKFMGGLSRRYSRMALRRMEENSILHRDASGRLRADMAFSIPSNAQRETAIRGYHAEMFRQAGDAVDAVGEARHIRGTMTSLTPTEYTSICQAIDDVIVRIRHSVSDSSESTRIYHCSMALFPMTIRPEADD